MSERMTDERLDSLTQSWQEHVGSLMEEYAAPTADDILSCAESETMELLDALKAERSRVAELEAKLADIAGLQRYSLVYDQMQQYDDGVWLKLDDVCQALKEQSGHE